MALRSRHFVNDTCKVLVTAQLELILGTCWLHGKTGTKGTLLAVSHVHIVTDVNIHMTFQALHVSAL